MLYRVVARIWDPIWLTVFLLWFFSVHKVTYIYYVGLSTWRVQNYLHKVTYIYYAIISRVK